MILRDQPAFWRRNNLLAGVIAEFLCFVCCVVLALATPLGVESTIWISGLSSAVICMFYIVVCYSISLCASSQVRDVERQAIRLNSESNLLPNYTERIVSETVEVDSPRTPDPASRSQTPDRIRAITPRASVRFRADGTISPGRPNALIPRLRVREAGISNLSPVAQNISG